MTKKIILCIVAVLFGFNNTSIFIGDVQIRLFHIFGAFLVASVINDFMIKKGQKVDSSRSITRWLLFKENGYSIFVMSIWFIYALISFLWIQSVPDWQLAIGFFVIGIFCVIVFSLFLKTREDLFQTFQIMGVVAIVHNIIGWYEVLTQDHLFADPERWGNRPVSVFYNTNNFAVFLFFSVFILYALAESNKNSYLKNFYKISAASSAILIYLTESRGVLLGLIIGLTILTALSNIDKFKINAKSFFRSVALMFLIAIATVSISSTVVDLFATDVAISVSHADRIALIKNGFAFLLETNGFGVGAGNIEHWMENYYHFNLVAQYNIRNMHNWWAEILAGYGIIIFSLYVGFYYKLIKNNLIKFHNSENQVDVALSKAMICIMGGFLIASAVPSTLVFHIFHWVFWAVAIAFQGTCQAVPETAIAPQEAQQLALTKLYENS